MHGMISGYNWLVFVDAVYLFRYPMRASAAYVV